MSEPWRADQEVQANGPRGTSGAFGRVAPTIALTDAVIERVQRRLVDDAAEPTPTALARALRAESTVLVSDAEMLRLIRLLQRELVGAGPLAELLADPRTT